MRTPQQERSTTSADRMLDATLDLLAAGGLAAVTVAGVARAAGTSNGSLYHRFGDRRGLLVAAQDRALARVEAETLAAFGAVDALPDDEAVARLAEVAVAMFGDHRAVLRAFLVEAQDDPDFQARSERCTHLIATTTTGWLQRRLGAGPEEAEAAYRVIVSLGITSALLDEGGVSPTPLAPAALAAALARAVLAIVSTPSTA
ncbi:TetR/AcrR family transcriptional regulator [Nocardioides sp. SYSU D00038]|uniref:TetR/AcrR family transcriptional regulator n=1 Tax=Nocardioides sp. SYSU D00038 TaxID=2812554 RepID=UPI001968A255|nr:TetR/AcrR family transcriptional regulator [Nocardioides sp. SYSU D00038]